MLEPTPYEKWLSLERRVYKYSSGHEDIIVLKGKYGVHSEDINCSEDFYICSCDLKSAFYAGMELAKGLKYEKMEILEENDY